MKVTWVGNKADIASKKHFGGKLNQADMTSLVIKTIKNATHIGTSRANPGFTPAKVVWGTVNGVEYAVIMDGEMIKKNIVEVVSFYDVSPQSRQTKISKLNLKQVK